MLVPNWATNSFQTNWYTTKSTNVRRAGSTAARASGHSSVLIEVDQGRDVHSPQRDSAFVRWEMDGNEGGKPHGQKR